MLDLLIDWFYSCHPDASVISYLITTGTVYTEIVNFTNSTVVNEQYNLLNKIQCFLMPDGFYCIRIPVLFKIIFVGGLGIFIGLFIIYNAYFTQNTGIFYWRIMIVFGTYQLSRICTGTGSLQCCGAVLFLAVGSGLLKSLRLRFRLSVQIFSHHETLKF